MKSSEDGARQSPRQRNRRLRRGAYANIPKTCPICGVPLAGLISNEGYFCAMCGKQRLCKWRTPVAQGRHKPLAAGRCPIC